METSGEDEFVDLDSIGHPRAFYTMVKGKPKPLIELINMHRNYHIRPKIRGVAARMTLLSLGGYEAIASQWYYSAHTAYGYIYGVQSVWDGKNHKYKKPAPVKPETAGHIVVYAGKKFERAYEKRGVDFPGIVPTEQSVIKHAQGVMGYRAAAIKKYFDDSTRILSEETGLSQKALRLFDVPYLTIRMRELAPDLSEDVLKKISGAYGVNYAELKLATRTREINELEAIQKSYLRVRNTAIANFLFTYQYLLFYELFDIDYRGVTEGLFTDFRTVYLPTIREMCDKEFTHIPPPAARTYYNISKGMTSLHKFMRDNGYLIANPLASLRMEKITEYNTPPYYIEVNTRGGAVLGRDDIVKLYKALKHAKQPKRTKDRIAALNDRDRVYIILRLFRETGARPSNMAWLRWKDVKIDPKRADYAEIDWLYAREPEHVMENKYPPKESHVAHTTCALISRYIDVNDVNTDEHVIGGAALFPGTMPGRLVTTRKLGSMLNLLSNRLIKAELLEFSISPLRFRKSFSTLMWMLIDAKLIPRITGDNLDTVEKFYAASGRLYSDIKYTGTMRPETVATKIFDAESW